MSIASLFLQNFIEKGLFPNKDIRITQSQPNQSRSECAVTINPIDKYNLIATSKKFIDPNKYQHTISTSHSENGGLTWTEIPLNLLPGWDRISDPAVAFDNIGNAFIVVEPIKVTSAGIETILGMYVYKSSDRGKTWSAPQVLHPNDPKDDKQWIACDNNPSSAYYGSVYVVWGAWSPMRFARTIDHGNTWKGVSNQPSGSIIHASTFAPEITVGDHGIIHIVWHIPNSDTIQYLRSTDGGETFEAAKNIVTKMTGLHSGLKIDTGDGFPHFPNGEFRVMTLATGCAVSPDRFIVAWADMREGGSRIYYRIGEHSGTTWLGPKSGQPLLPQVPDNNNLHHFHPQLIATKNGVVGCAFYEFGEKSGKYLIDTLLAGSFSQGNKFGYLTTVTDQPWDPAVNAPWVHGNPNETFIGEYFGLDADDNSFCVVWTDTRSGVQELFFDRVLAITSKRLIELSAEILFGVTKDGGGLIMVGGKIIRIPPRGPKMDILNAMVALDSAEQIEHQSRFKVVQSITNAIEQIVKSMNQKKDR